jgi:hypothetical protein
MNLESEARDTVGRIRLDDAGKVQNQRTED